MSLFSEKIHQNDETDTDHFEVMRVVFLECVNTEGTVAVMLCYGFMASRNVSCH